MQHRSPRARTTAVLAVAAVVAGVFPGTLATAAGPTPPAPSTSAGQPVNLDVLFVGAHPDDEASALSTLGQWRETHDVGPGVVTITRGEGGGNAVGPEEGPALGLIREGEERRAVGKAGAPRCSTSTRSTSTTPCPRH
jgi:hypothetical protein